MLETLFWASTAAVVYTYFGYPLLIGLAGKLLVKPVRRAEYCPPVTVIVVAHNEEHTIRARLDNLLQQDYPTDKLAIIVASDGSVDSTNDIVSACDNPAVSLLAFDAQRGKAACLNDAVASCATDYLIFADARQRFDPAAIRQLMSNFSDPDVGAVSGELIIETEAGSGFSQGVDFYWKYEKFIRQAEARFASVIGVTGAIYALRKACFKALPTGLILDDVLVPMNTVRAGMRVGFEPLALAYDIPPPNPEWEHRRKVRTLAGNYQLMQMSPGLLAPWRNPVWIQFMSHKVLRLIAPAFLLAAVVTNILLAGKSPVYTTTLIIQLCFYAAALLGITMPATHKLAAIRIPMTFCRLNWSAVLGFREFVARRSGQLW